MLDVDEVLNKVTERDMGGDCGSLDEDLSDEAQEDWREANAVSLFNSGKERG